MNLFLLGDPSGKFSAPFRFVNIDLADLKLAAKPSLLLSACLKFGSRDFENSKESEGEGKKGELSTAVGERAKMGGEEEITIADADIVVEGTDFHRNMREANSTKPK